MKDYLEKRRAELKKRGNKGFTLMEMLIVVAIIAVLIAIAIPIFTSQLEKSREAADAANIRSAYAEVTANYLSDNKAHSIDVACSSNFGDWKSDPEMKIANIKASEVLSGSGSSSPVKVAVDASGNVTIGSKKVESGMTTTS